MTWVTGVAAVTLVVEDVAAAERFYADVFELPVHYRDEQSVVFDLGNAIVNLLDAGAAAELVDPAPVAPPADAVRAVLTVRVPDVDAVCARLAERGVPLLNGPMDRPWGPRTASFRDPGGHVWEVASG